MPTKIEWTNKTWNPITGCSKVSAGCKNCYAERMHKRQMVLNPEKYAHPFLDGAFPHEQSLEAPLHWRKPAMIFVNSMSDLFHENVPFEFIDKVMAVINKSGKHTFQILTKRPERALEYYNYRKQKYSGAMSYEDIWGKLWYPNLWLGTSVEDQATADERIPYLLQIPAAVRFLSCEPLLGEVDLRFYQCECGKIINANTSTKRSRIQCTCDKSEEYYTMKPVNVDWVITGGESGPGSRPMHPEWPRKLRDQCISAGVPFFFKQWGEYLPAMQVEAGFDLVHTPSLKKLVRVDERMYYKLTKKHTGRLLDGKEWSEYPEVNSEIGKKQY